MLARAHEITLSPTDVPAGEWEEVEALVREVQITADAGGVNPGDRRALYYLVRRLQPRAILEVGTHIGASTTHLGLALRRLAEEDRATSRQLVSVDIEDVNDPVTRPWDHYGATYSPAEATHRLGLDDYVQFTRASATSFMQSAENRYDLIFLDGDHSAGAVYRELCAALRILNPGGSILLHDFFPDGEPLWSNGSVIAGPWRAVSRLRREGAAIEVAPLGELPWATKLGSNVTSLALVGAAG